MFDWKRVNKRVAIGRWVASILFVLLILPTVHRVSSFHSDMMEHILFTDYSIFQGQAKRFQESGRLYDTDAPGYHSPGSHYYKWPPPTAAFLTFYTDKPPRQHAKFFVKINYAELLLAFVLIIVTFRPRFPRMLLMSLVFFHWLPFVESLHGVQLEPLFLLFLAISALALRAQKPFVAGLPLGLGAALKVYPGLLCIYFLIRRQWRAIIGIAVAAAVTLAAASFVIPPRHTLHYFLHVLPNLGGTDLRPENLSGLSSIGRLVLVLLTGREEAGSQMMGNATLEACGVPGVRFLTMVLFLLLVGLLVFGTVRWHRRTAGSAARVREPVALAIVVCILLIMLPCSWVNYQTLLAFSLLAALSIAPRVQQDPLTWILLAMAAVPGIVLNYRHPFLREHLGTCAAIRCFMPLWVWIVLLRSRLAPSQEAPEIWMDDPGESSTEVQIQGD